MKSSIDNKINDLIAATSSPLLIAIEQGGSGFRIISSGESECAGNQIYLAKLMLKSGDLDSFIRSVILDAEKNGHSSIFLKALGVPEKPMS